MDSALPVRRSDSSPAVEAAIGAIFIAIGVVLSLAEQQALFSGLFGLAGMAIWRHAARLPALTPIAIVDFFAFAIFAFQRNDHLVLWQLVGPWADVWRFNVSGAAIAYAVYIVGSLFTLASAHRAPRFVEALGLIVLPYVFSMLVALGADWHMAEIAKLLPPLAPLDFRYQVLIGRAVALFGIAEAGLAILSFVALNRWLADWRVHVLLAVSAALGAATPLIANAAQLVTTPVLLIAVGVAAGAIAQASLWGLVYVATGLPLDALAGRPASFLSVRGHWRTGFVKGAIYGGVFMALVLIASSILTLPGLAPTLRALIWLTGPLGGALAFPFAQTVIGSADGTPPFFGRLIRAYQNPWAYARGLVLGFGLAYAFHMNTPGEGGGARFVICFLFGALAYAGVDALADYLLIVERKRTKMQTWRKYALGILLGGFVGGAIGWYFDAAQVAVVASKFWAYSDVNYRLSGRHVGDFTTYPIFNKFGAINLGEVAGGVKLFWAESVSGMINWSLAAPLFSINMVLLSALLDQSLKPFRDLFSSRGAEGLLEQAVRVMRWGLWMAPIINTFLRQSPDPSWYNQDGAVRTLVATGAEIVMPYGDFRNFSLTVFLGLLAYDWLRVIIWFDHMGLRVATLVNLSFAGGDRADEAAGRFLGHGARTRAIPDGIRRFGTWAPLLIPFYIPRGAEWDKAWTGAEQLSHGGAMPAPVTLLGFVYSLAGIGIAASAVVIGEQMRAPRSGSKIPAPDAPPTLDAQPQVFSFTNGEVSMELWRDGRGAAAVTGDARGGFAIDLIRRPLDPLQPRGPFFYLTEDEGQPWSIGFQPTRKVGEYSIRQSAFNQVELVNTHHSLRAELIAGPDREGAVLSFRVRLTDLSGRARRLRLTSFSEIAAHETGAYARDLDFAGMHVETIFVLKLNAILARNRLLRSARADRGEIAFFAVKPGEGMELVGYEDSRTRFLGEGSMRAPTGCEANRWRRLDDEGKLWTFDPCASFTLTADIPADGEVEAEFVIGRADNAAWASDLISRRLNLPPLPEIQLQTWIYETRALEPTPALPTRWPFSFSADGRTLHLSHRTPRPWAHVMANEIGASVVVSNDGDVYSAFGNSRHNALTAFRFDSATTPMPGQIVYLRDLHTRETDSTGFAPFQRADATIEIAYEPGVATFVKQRGALASTYEIFAPPDFPGDMRILTLANKGTQTLKLRIAPFFDMALDEGPNESAGHLEAWQRDGVLLYRNRRNDMVRGVAFVTTTLDKPRTEMIRRRFFGPPGRDITCPAMVDAGEADLGRSDDGRRVAAFVSEIELKPGEQMRFALAIGMGRDEKAALAAARTLSVAEAERLLGATRAMWAKRLSVVEIETNRPDFDRLINTWLPYQVYASRLFGRVGPNQRGGAFGYRDQLQDVLPLSILEPRLTRAQIVLHAGQQFLEGDVVKWWHVGPNGGTGIAQRTKASDPHLWLPYVLARYVRESGDAGVLDEVQCYLEAPAVPERDDTLLVTPRPSRESATVYEHAKLAIAFTLEHMGENGLPLLRAGDWNDGIDALGRAEKGTGVWMGFFLYTVIEGFLPLARLKGDEAFALRCEAEAAKLRQALEVGWFGDHYGLDFSDDGRAISMPNAMTTGWAAHSGAADHSRAIAALEGGLAGIEKANRILLLENPFFEHSEPYPGRIADYPPGVRENGGQYSHGASWIIDGFSRVAREARANGDATASEHLYGRAFQIFEKISPLGKTDPETLSTYGLIPIQQPADIYDGFGHGGRGGWSWYTGSAARMLSAAYGIVGIEKSGGAVSLADDASAPKGELQVKRVRVGKQVWGADRIGQ